VAEGPARGLTLDAGALIAAEKNHPKVWAYVKRLKAAGLTVTVPAGVLAQTWRGLSNARLSQFLAGCFIEPLDEPAAKATGALCARARSSDIVDASVLVGAAARHDVVFTSDATDLRKLAELAPGAVIVPIDEIE